MQVVILAAGMGKRMGEMTKNHTKSMVQILGKTFLEHSLDKLTKFPVSKIIIVIGYFGEEIKKIIGNSYNNIPVFYEENKNYASTNNIYSLFLAKDYLKNEDTLLLESDLIYEESIIEKLLNNPYPNLAVVDKYKAHMDGTVVKINENDEITAFISKEHFDYKEIDSYYKTVNIYKLSKKFLCEEYLPFLEAYCDVMGKNSYYEQVMKVLLSLDKNDLRVLKLNGEKWYEVDDIQDYDIAETIFSNEENNKLEKYNSRFGGYWRFSGLKDFCYLANPYFPPKRMMCEIKSNLESLIASYPSCQNIDKLLLSNIFNIKKENILLGNGACEILNVLLPEIKGNAGIVLPVFQEYISRMTGADIKYFIPKNSDFSYSVENLIEFSKDTETLILVNPDNPSGNFILKDDVILLLDKLKKENKILILDESFIDFADNAENNSLLNQEILTKYPNLVLIKSISKSYGIPGLRLGILASSNENILNTVNKKLPVWNINSIGEFFIQVLSKYKKSFKDSCKMTSKSREEFYKLLSGLDFLRPIKSQANYILCEVFSPYTSGEICKKLLQKNFLIKDCAQKLGFEGKQYIRIAVKSVKENLEIFDALKNLK